MEARFLGRLSFIGRGIEAERLAHHASQARQTNKHKVSIDPTKTPAKKTHVRQAAIAYSADDEVTLKWKGRTRPTQ
jgi:hypothetical protein